MNENAGFYMQLNNMFVVRARLNVDVEGEEKIVYAFVGDSATMYHFRLSGVLQANHVTKLQLLVGASNELHVLSCTSLPG